MADRIKIKVDGLRELGESLKALNMETRLKIVRAMTSGAAKLVQERAVAHAPDSEEPHRLDGVLIQPGNLKKNIIQRRNTKTSLTSEHYVTVRGGEKGKYASRYGVLVEYGTVKMPQRKFLRRSFLEQVNALPGKMAEIGKRKIEAAAKRAAKKPKKSKL